MTYAVAVTVEVAARAERSLRRVPRHVAVGFLVWKREVEHHGLEVIRNVPGYRLFYRVSAKNPVVVTVEEVNKHDYKAIERLFGR
jgi:hypothetical protein